MRVITIPCLQDNYAYLLVDSAGIAIVIDPSEVGPVADAVAREHVELTAIWLTHHHHDHVGGVEGLCDAFPITDVIGSRYDATHRRIPRQSRGVGEGDTIAHGTLTAQVMEIPGHTLGAVAYRVGQCLLTGDTLFLGGCGRVFEGTLPQMQASLARLRGLDPNLLVYPGHEYTVNNLRFGLSIEPDNADMRARWESAQQMRARAEPTVPGRLSEELRTNVLLRWDAPAVIAHAQVGTDPAHVFAEIRAQKDRF